MLRVLPPLHHYILAYIGIYGIATTGQIKDGKDMYRTLEAHFSLYLALYKLYMSKFVDNNQEIEKKLREAVVNAISDFSDYTKEKNNVKQNIPVFPKL